MLAQTLLGDALNGLVHLQVDDPDTPEFLCTKFFDTYIDCLQGRVKDEHLSPTVDFTKRWLDDPQLRSARCYSSADSAAAEISGEHGALQSVRACGDRARGVI